VQEVLHPAAAAARPAIVKRLIACFQCGTELEPPAAAQSTMCKRCSSYVDLADYQIAQTVSKNFRTHGRLVVEEKGFVLNTEALVGEALVKGRVIGKLKAERTLEIHSSARIQGAISGGVLVIPRGHHFRWPEVLQVSGAEIGGELVGELSSTGRVVLRSTARFFGDVHSPDLIVEAGAVLAGSVDIARG
jgi:cytoskeletal protein CcmA (bactofilin family)